MKLEAKELRIGNLINYRIVDKMDERQEWVEVTEIDYDDLRILGIKHEINQDYQPIELTEEWLLKFGFISNPYDDVYELGDFNVHCDKCTGTLMLYCVINNKIVDLETVHHLQNLYYSIHGEELTIKN